MDMINDQKHKIDHETICANDIGHTDNSVFQPGIVIRHKIKNGYFNTVPVFVIGNDRKSIHWVRLNKK